MRSSLILAENLLHSHNHYLLSSHIIGKWTGLGVNLQALRTLYPFAAIYKCCLKRRFKLVEPITGDHPVKLPKTLFASWAVRCLLFVMLNSSFRGLDMRGKQNFGVTRFKVARYSFSGSIPLKFEHKLRRLNKGLEKLPPQLYYIKMKICYDQGWHRSCHNNEMMPLRILLAAVFLVTGNCSSKLVHGSFFLQ